MGVQWPDGEGSFHVEGATPLELSEIVKRMDQFDWTEGLYLRQGRAKAEECPSTSQLGACYPELERGSGGTASYGYNWTQPAEPPAHPWLFFDQHELGSSPDGLLSAEVASQRTYDAEGYIALAIPFFSDTYLPPQEGDPSEVIDFREHYVNTTNGRVPRHYCVRLSPNGRHIRQLCDPGVDGRGTEPYTGAVRAAVEEWWNDLKRGHFLDAQSRALQIALQLKSNHQGVRYRLTLLVELTSLGALFTSYDVETRILDAALVEQMMRWSHVALGLVVFFSLLELLEIASGGLADYFSNVWNVADWANYIVYFMYYAQLLSAKQAMDHRDCSSYLCSEVPRRCRGRARRVPHPHRETPGYPCTRPPPACSRRHPPLTTRTDRGRSTRHARLGVLCAGGIL